MSETHAKKSRAELWRQVDDACPKCGSYHRIVNDCNACGTFAPGRASVRKPFHEGKLPQGQSWDSKKHKYSAG